ncbi:hypothetical protein [Mycoplasma sp. Z1473D]
MFSTVKSKWGVIVVSIIIFLILNLVPIAIGRWPFGGDNTWLAFYIVSKVLCDLYFIGFVVYYVMKEKPFAHSGIMIIVIISVLGAQLIPLIGRLWWFAFGGTQLQILWYIIYLLVAFTLIFVPIGLYAKVNAKMLQRDVLAEPDEIPVRKTTADEDGFSNMRKRD